MSANKLFNDEIGKYLKLVSEEYPIGVCIQCGTLRARHDVNASEGCPAFLIKEIDNNDINPVAHKWVAATNSEELEDLIKNNFSKFKALSIEAEKLLAS